MRGGVGHWRLVTSVLALSLTASACSSANTVAGDQTTPTSTTLAPVTTTTALSPIVTWDGAECRSSIPKSWPSGALPIEISNQTTTRIALVMGTYNDGFGHDDLVSYGRDISTRPDFIDSLEIYEVGSNSTLQISFNHGPGQYFTVCMDSTSTMIVLNDLIVSD